jgi:hypothetical protein
MNKLEAISTILQHKEVEILKKYYQKAIENKSQHFEWEKINEDLSLDYSTLKSLSALGFVNIEMEKGSRDTIYDSYYLTLYPSAIQRAEFEEYSKLRKSLAKNLLNYQGLFAVAGFVISVVLAVIKVIEFWVNK